MTAKLKYIPIVPSSGLYLPAWGYGDDRRFASQFRATWLRIPRSCRMAMNRNWNTQRQRWRDLIAASEDRDALANMIPRVLGIELLKWKSDWFRGPSGEAVAQFTAGREGSASISDCLSFWSVYVDAMPDEHLQTLIAHELSHAFLYAIGDGYHMDAEREYWDRELDVSEQLQAWDFDEDAYEEFVENNLQHLKHDDD